MVILLPKVTLKAGFLLVPELLALLPSSVPHCQHFPWGHCCSIGLAHAVGIPSSSALLAAFHEECSFSKPSLKVSVRIPGFKEKRFKSSPNVEMYNKVITQLPSELLGGHTVPFMQ